MSTEETSESDHIPSEVGSSNIQTSSPQRWSSDGAAATREPTTTGNRFHNNNNNHQATNIDASNYNPHFAATSHHHHHHHHHAAAAAAMNQSQLPPPNLSHLSHAYQKAFFPRMMQFPHHYYQNPHHHHQGPQHRFNYFQQFPPQPPPTEVPPTVNATASSSSNSDASNNTSPPHDPSNVPQMSSRQEELEEELTVAHNGVEFGQDVLVNGLVPQALSTRAQLVVPPLDYEMPSMQNVELSNIVTPLENDVLCGRGGGANNWAGNEKFRLLVKKQQFVYVKADKRDKPNVSLGVVRAVRAQNPPGRFLQRDEATGLWYDIGDAKAREKAAQALREGAPVIRCSINKSKRAALLNNTNGDEEPISPSSEQLLRQERYDKAAMALVATAATMRRRQQQQQQHHPSLAESMARAASSASMGSNANNTAMTGGMNMMPPMHLMMSMPPAFGHHFQGFHFPPVPHGPPAPLHHNRNRRHILNKTSQHNVAAHPQATNDSSNPPLYRIDTSMPADEIASNNGTMPSEVEAAAAGPAIITPRETSPTFADAVTSRDDSDHRSNSTANGLKKRPISEISDSGPPPQQQQQQ